MATPLKCNRCKRTAKEHQAIILLWIAMAIQMMTTENKNLQDLLGQLATHTLDFPEGGDPNIICEKTIQLCGDVSPQTP